MSVVRDSNAIVSGLNRPGNERCVLDLALRGRFAWYLSSFILEEVAGVLVRKFGWPDERSSQMLRATGDAATVIEPHRLPETNEDGPAFPQLPRRVPAPNGRPHRPRPPQAGGGAVRPGSNGRASHGPCESSIAPSTAGRRGETPWVS